MRQFSLVMLAASMLWCSGCVHKAPPPAPVYGVDIVAVEKGSPAPLSGTLFSPFYLDNYLQWKEGK